MSEHMKERPTNRASKQPTELLIFWSENGCTYELPKSTAASFTNYIITDKKQIIKAKIKLEKIFSIIPEEDFLDINQKYTRPGALLKGVRLREGLNQKEFAEKISVEQGDLSKMENGKRPIGKIIAHRIAKKFNVNYKLFL
jgi:DNA-binding XRE family transcriptional regulator